MLVCPGTAAGEGSQRKPGLESGNRTLGTIALEYFLWNIHSRIFLMEYPFWNISYAPKQTKDVLCPPALPTPVCCPPWHSSGSFGECFPHLFHPKSPSSARAGSWGAQTSPDGQFGGFAVFMELQVQLESPTSPIPALPVLPVLPEVRKAAGRERRGQSQAAWGQPQDQTSDKGQELPHGKAGIVALGHSAHPLPISPAQTCPAPVSSHSSMGKYLRKIFAGIKQKRDDEMGSLHSHFSSHQAVIPRAQGAKSTW